MVADILKPGAIIAELGVFLGEFAKTLYDTQPHQLVLIDPWEGQLPSGDRDGNNVRVVDLPEVYKMMTASLGNIRTIQIRRGLSFDILPQYPDNYFDFIYIDSSHSYEGTKKELLLSLQKIKRGGVIACHDYEVNPLKCKHHYDFGVKKAVDEFCADFGYEISYKALDGCVSVGIQI